MPEAPVAELTLALLGNPASFEKMMAGAEARLETFAAKIDSAGSRIQASMDRTLGYIGSAAGKANAALQPLASAWGEVASAASVAGAESKAAAGELSSAAAAARQAASSLNAAGTAGRNAGVGISAGMAQTATSVQRSSSSLSGFLGLVNRVRSAASKPIVQRVTVQRSGGSTGASSKGASSGGRGGEQVSGYGLVTAGGAILGVEGAMIKQGMTLEDELAKLYATAGETRNYESLRQELLSISQRFGVLPVEAAKALYPIESLGFHGAQAMQVLTAAANMAKGSQTDVAVTGELISKTLNTYGLSADHAARLSDIFTRAIKDGNVQGKDFVGAYASVQTVAKNAGLSVEETAAALAVMTHNAKSANIGGTQLRAFLSGLITPTKAVKDAARDAGLGWLAAGRGADEIKRVGLPGVLDEIKEATHGNVTALGLLLPDMRKNQAAMALLNNGGGVFTRTMKDVKDSLGATDAASKVMDKTLGQSSRNMDAAFAAASSNLETALKPLLTWVYGKVTGLINLFNRLPGSMQTTIGVGAAITGALLVVVGTTMILLRWVSAVGDMFVKTGVKGVAANGEIAVSAGLAATAEEGLATAAEGAGTAAAGAGEAGALAFASGGPFMLAIGAAVLLVGGLAYQWWKLTQEQDAAARSAQAYYDKLKDNEAAGGLKGLVATQQDIQQGHGGIDRTQDAIKNIKANLAQAKANGGMGAGGAAGEGAYGGKTASQWQADLDQHQARLTQLKADLATTNAQIKSAQQAGGGEADRALQHADGLAPYQVPLLKAVGEFHNASVQCGEFIRRGAAAFGFKGSIQAAANAALRGKNVVRPDGVDVHGAPRYPNGTVIYFGSQGHQHFVDTYVNDRGEQKALENTEAGTGKGKWRVRADRNVSDIMAEYHGKAVAFKLAGVAGAGGGTPPPTNSPSEGGAEPDWAKKLGEGKAKAAKSAGVGGTADIPLKHLDALMPENLGRAATDAQTYEEKLRRLNDALAEHGLHLQESGKAYDTYSLKVSELHQRLSLAQTAIENTGKAMAGLSSKVGADESKLSAARSAYNADSDRLKAKKSSGAVYSAEDEAQHGRLKAAYDDALASYQRDDTALRENARVHAQAVQDKIGDLEALTAAQEENEQKQTTRFLKEQQLALKSGAINRDQYDGMLQTALAGKNKSVGKLNPEGDDYGRVQDALTQSQIARQQAQDKIGKDTLTLQKKDFDALEQGLNEEVQAYRDAGVAEADIATWRNLKQHELDMARTKQARDDALSMAQEMTSLGLETQAQLQQQMGQAITSLQADMAQATTSAEAQGFALQIAKLRLEVGKIDWEAAGKQAEGWKQAVDTGKLSVEEYILRLRDLQGQIPATAEEYQRLTSEIDAANKAMYDKASEQAGAVASKASDQIMAVLQKAKTLKQAIRESLKDAANDAIHKTIEDAIKKQVLHILVQSDADKMQKAAQKHEAATNALGGHVTRLASGVTAFGAGVDKFGQFVTQFSDLMSQPAAGNGGAFGQGDTSGGAFGQGNTSGGAFGQGGTSSGGAFGQGGSASSAPVPVTVTGHDNTGKSVAQADNDVSAAVSVVHASQGMGSGVGAVSNAASVATTVASASKWAQASSALSAASPYIAAAVMIASFFGPKKAPAPTVVHDQKYASVLSSFSSTIDSGYSGSDGLRTLLGPTTRQAAGVSTTGQAGPGHTLNVTIAAGAFSGIADPQGHANVMLTTLQDGLARMNAVDNASRGNG